MHLLDRYIQFFKSSRRFEIFYIPLLLVTNDCDAAPGCIYGTCACDGDLLHISPMTDDPTAS